MNLIFIKILIFIFGAFIGSFLCCFVSRIIIKQSVLKGRSYCFGCQKKLKFFELIPILSFIFLKGHCLKCKQKIPLTYLLFEFCTGLIFVSVYLFYFSKFNFTAFDFFILSYLFYIVSVLILVFYIDLKLFLILDKIILPASVIVFFINVFFIGQNTYLQNLFNFGLGGILVTLFFLIQFILTKGRGIGGGDIKLGFFIGVLLGIKFSFIAVFMAYIIGCIIVLILFCFKKATLKTKLPLGSFLAVATYIVLVYHKFVGQIFDFLFKFYV